MTRTMAGVGMCIMAWLAVELGHAAPDKIGLERRGLYTITTTVGGKVMAWTHVVPADRAKDLIGTNPAKETVELRPLEKGNKAQLWLFNLEGADPSPYYHIFSRISWPEDNPHSPAMVVDVNGDFSGDEDTKFHDKYNRLSVGLNQSSTDRGWLVIKQPDGRFKIQSLLGAKDRLRPKGDSYGFGDERVLEAFVTKEGVRFRHRPPSGVAGQLWTLTKDGYL